MKHYVYLAGPITGLTYEGAQDWRDKAAEVLDSDKVETLSPLRGKNYLLGRGELHSGAYPEVMSTAKGINRRDYFDCTRADCVTYQTKTLEEAYELVRFLFNEKN